MNAIILHGTGDKNDLFWFPYVKHALEQKGYTVWLPQLPNAETPNLQDWLSFVLANAEFNADTILIGHSAGAQLILSILENISVKIKQAVLVSGYAKALRKTPDAPKNVDDFNWTKMHGKFQNIVFINSDNDPWGCNDTQGRIMLDHLGGILVIPKGEGHMGSTTHQQPYKEFPLLVKLLDI
jgi:uncharacterized protein